MNAWRVVYRWFHTHPFTVDAAFAVTLFVIATIAMATTGVAGSERPTDAIAYLLLAGQTLPLAFRRIHPLGVMYVVVACVVPFWVLDYPAGFDPAAMVAVYSATAHGVDRRRTWINVSAVVLVISAVATIGVLVPQEDLPAVAVLGIVAIHGTAAILGEVVYQRRQRIVQLEQRAEAAEAELETKSRLAALDERSRIAREMHDVVAHGMSVIVVQAGAAKRLVASDPDRAAEALGNIESTGRESLTEMRRMLGVLRDPDNEPELAPQPTLSDFTDLVHHAVEAGVDASMEVYGVPRSAVSSLELAAYRVLQEALTNIVKHAGRPVTAEVKVVYEPDHIVIEVTDDGLGAAAAIASNEPGHGLIGMRERVELYQGELEAGPRDGGGFRVRAAFPTNTASNDGARPATPSAGAELAETQS